MNPIVFNHKMAAHCESGTVTALLNHAGMEITEPMVFGIANGLFFGYFAKQPGFTFPTFIVRNKPGQMRENISKRLGVKFNTYNFKDIQKGEAQLHDLLNAGIPVGTQVDFFYMEYLPAWERVHINVHYITVIGKEGQDYLVSDCYFPEVARLHEELMRKARFAGGMMAPKGFIFHPVSIPPNPDLEKAIRKGLKKTVFYMLKIPMPFLGIKGIRMFARKITDWPKYARDVEHLSHEIMKINILLEDQGTGGGGFRYMFATFLQQASGIIQEPALKEMSERMMQIGDGWRELSLFAARIGKNRDLGEERLKELSQLIAQRADAEETFFRDLSRIIK